MCGIVGFTNDIDNSSEVLGRMMDRIKHRGPDAEGKYVDDKIALGHRRLSIIDVSSQGDQPIISDDGSLFFSTEDFVFLLNIRIPYSRSPTHSRQTRKDWIDQAPISHN